MGLCFLVRIATYTYQILEIRHLNLLSFCS